MGNAVERIGRYEILRLVGRGGMGQLYQARDTVLDREVAVKVMYAESVGDDHARERFYREARAVAKLSHRHIVTIFEFSEEHGVPYIVMEFLRGQSLGDALRRGARLDLRQKLAIVIDLCEGLHYAHRQGVIHRDVKPANIWLLPDGSVKLLDFGIAKMAEGTFTRAGAMVGSAAYMSPEQIAGQPASARSDVFAAGVVLYELVTGRRPFEGESITAVIMKIMNEAPRDVRSVAPGVPEAVASVIDLALQKDAANRYANAEDMATDLRLAELELDTEAAAARPRRQRLAEPPPDFDPPDYSRKPQFEAVAAAHFTPVDDARSAAVDVNITYVDVDRHTPPVPRPRRRRRSLLIAALVFLPLLTAVPAYVFMVKNRVVAAEPLRSRVIGPAVMAIELIDVKAARIWPEADSEVGTVGVVNQPPRAQLRILSTPGAYTSCEASVGAWKGYPFDGLTRIQVPPRTYPITIRCAGRDPVSGTIDIPPGNNAVRFKDAVKLNP